MKFSLLISGRAYKPVRDANGVRFEPVIPYGSRT
jgi:hypothetical protein